MKAAEYAAQANDIFVLADSFLRIKTLIDNETSTIDDISQVIMLDPALAGTVLKLANSSFFNYPRKIDTLTKAILVLGITEIYNLVIAKCTTDAFKKLEASNQYLEEFWLQSVVTALVLKQLGNQLKVPNAERLFILGLLHNLGELVIKQFKPEIIDSSKITTITILPWLKEQQLLGFAFADCSAELLKCWQLPFSIIEPIRQQNQENFSQLNIETKLLFIAKRTMLKNLYFPNEAYSSFFTEEQLEELGLTEENLNNAVTFAQLEKMTILNILKPGSVSVY